MSRPQCCNIRVEPPDTFFLNIRRDEADALNRLKKAVSEAPDPGNKLPQLAIYCFMDGGNAIEQ